MNATETAGHLPDTERTIVEYARAARAKWLSDPFRQTLRIARRRARELRESSPLPAPLGAQVVRVPRCLRPPSLKYAGYRGPWFEEHFAARHGGDAFPGAEYLPIFWDNFFAHAQGHAFLPGEFAIRFRAMWNLLAELAATDRAYFTIQGIYDFPIWNWHRFPRNVLVLAGNGYGDLAIPLLKGDRPFRRPPKNLSVSFMGRTETDEVRRRMQAVFADAALFDCGAHWEEVMGRSHFSLCPRGLGPASFRMYEALSLGSIPAYIWERWRWLPYAEELDWSEFSMVAEAGQMVALKESILGMPPARVRQMQDRIAAVYDAYFSYTGTARWIGRKMAGIATRADAEQLTARRSEFRF